MEPCHGRPGSAGLRHPILLLYFLGVLAGVGCDRVAHVVGERSDGSSGSGGSGGAGGRTDGGAGDARVICEPGFPEGSTRPAGDGCNTCSCQSGGAWVCSTAFCEPDASVLGDAATDTGGRSGSGGAGGRGGAGGGLGGAAGSGAPCLEATVVDRSCAIDADCVAVMHVMNCCGGKQWIGIRSSEAQRFGALEQQCRAGYPPCGCFDDRNGTDDGSRIPELGSAQAACLNGRCVSYAPACARPCPSGSSCLVCATGAQALCSPSCSAQAPCQGDLLSKCIFGNSSTGLCAPAATTCEPPN